VEVYSTEDQQVDAIKQFWKDYGTSVVVGAVVGLGGLFGWNYYSDHQLAQAEAASESFQALSSQDSADPIMLSAAETFAKEHGQKGYESLLALMVAKAAVESGDLETAATTLNNVIAENVDSSIVLVATMRLARVQAEQGQFAAAIMTLEQIKDVASSAQRDELKGDILVRQGDFDKAKLAYQAAIESGGAQSSSTLQMKLDNLNKA